MPKPTIDLTTEQAQEAVQQASLSEQEKADCLKFIQHFPQALFFANTAQALSDFQRQQGVQLPAWFLACRATLAEAYAGADDLAVQFVGRLPSASGRRSLEGQWYTLSLPGLPKGKKERSAFLLGSTTLKLFPIALNIQDDRYQLGINLSEQDTQIYSYHLEDINAAYSAKEDISAYVSPVFETYAQMLSDIKAIQHGGQISHKVN